MRATNNTIPKVKKQDLESVHIDTVSPRSDFVKPKSVYDFEEVSANVIGLGTITEGKITKFIVQSGDRGLIVFIRDKDTISGLVCIDFTDEKSCGIVKTNHSLLLTFQMKIGWHGAMVAVNTKLFIGDTETTITITKTCHFIV